MTDALRQRLRALPGLLGAAALLAVGLVHGVPLLVSDLQSQGARQNVETWARQQQGWTVEEWQRTRTQLLAALQTAPGDPGLHNSLAQLYVTQGVLAWSDDNQRLAFFGEALVHQQRALALRPTDSYLWSQVAVSHYALGSPMAEVQQAFAQAMRHAPREAGVQRAMVDLTLAMWPQAPTEMRDWVLQTWQAAAPAVRKHYEADARKWGRPEVFQPPQ